MYLYGVRLYNMVRRRVKNRRRAERRRINRSNRTFFTVTRPRNTGASQQWGMEWMRKDWDRAHRRMRSAKLPRFFGDLRLKLKRSHWDARTAPLVRAGRTPVVFKGFAARTISRPRYNCGCSAKKPEYGCGCSAKRPEYGCGCANSARYECMSCPCERGGM